MRRINLIPMPMYTQYVTGQLKLLPADREKQIYWLRAEESSLMREATRLAGENPEQATDILLAYMSRLTHIRQLLDAIPAAPLYA